MTAVLAEFERGATSLAEVADRTGLDLDLVRAVVGHLVRMGRMTSENLATGCPSHGCGGCAVAAADGSSCAPGPTAAAGPVLLRLTSR